MEYLEAHEANSLCPVEDLGAHEAQMVKSISSRRVARGQGVCIKPRLNSMVLHDRAENSNCKAQQGISPGFKC